MRKRIITIIICLVLCGATYYKLDPITNTIIKYFNNTPTIKVNNKNKYSKNQSYKFVSITNDFTPYNFQDLLNIFYTILDAGYDTFTFYCPTEYEDCIKDVERISNKDNVELLTTLGNYVSPFNNFTSLKVQYDTAGEVTVNITKLYSEQDILNIQTEIERIWKTIVTKDMTNEDIIYAFHDFIINNTKYDEAYEEELKHGKTTHQASKANGPLFEGYAICSGYTDVMSLLLDRLNIINYKVASDSHVWNAVYLNDKWVHLDLTWDDPVSIDHSQDNLLHKFFLIDTPTLESFDIKDHTFNKSVYLELK